MICGIVPPSQASICLHRERMLLESCWETGGSRPRKYYRRTGYGDEVYARLREQWIELAGGMENLLKEDQA